MSDAPTSEWFDMTQEEMAPFVMRHDCAKSCWNYVHRPRLERLKKCFGGLETRIKPQDIDGAVEHLGYFLFLEFKGSRDNFVNQLKPRKKTALDIYHQAITSQVRIVHSHPLVLSSPTTTTVYIAGDSKTMQIDEIRVVHAGKFYDWEKCDLYGLQVLCWEWFEWTKQLSEEDRGRARTAVAESRVRNPWLKRATKEANLED